jgi:hypothetical protein
MFTVKPDIEVEMVVLRGRVGLYSAATDRQRELLKQETEVLDWLCRDQTDCHKAQSNENLTGHCNWFFQNIDYKNWVKELPVSLGYALICSGRGKISFSWKAIDVQQALENLISCFLTLYHDVI